MGAKKLRGWRLAHFGRLVWRRQIYNIDICIYYICLFILVNNELTGGITLTSMMENTNDIYYIYTYIYIKPNKQLEL